MSKMLRRWPVQLSFVVSEEMKEEVKALNAELEHDSLGDTLRYLLQTGINAVRVDLEARDKPGDQA